MCLIFLRQSNCFLSCLSRRSPLTGHRTTQVRERTELVANSQQTLAPSVTIKLPSLLFISSPFSTALHTLEETVLTGKRAAAGVFVPFWQRLIHYASPHFHLGESGPVVEAPLLRCCLCSHIPSGSTGRVRNSVFAEPTSYKLYKEGEYLAAVS